MDEDVPEWWIMTIKNFMINGDNKWNYIISTQPA